MCECEFWGGIVWKGYRVGREGLGKGSFGGVGGGAVHL
jgi:hypothetical protein